MDQWEALEIQGRSTGEVQRGFQANLGNNADLGIELVIRVFSDLYGLNYEELKLRIEEN